MDSTVLVVGAGPVGLTAASELARQGAQVRMIEATRVGARTGRRCRRRWLGAAPGRRPRAGSLATLSMRCLALLGWSAPSWRSWSATGSFAMWVA